MTTTTTLLRKSAAPARGAAMQGRYQTAQQHDISRCERGLSPILGATCRCGGALFSRKSGDGYAFFEQLPPTDPHSFHFGEEEIHA